MSQGVRGKGKEWSGKGEGYECRGERRGGLVKGTIREGGKSRRAVCFDGDAMRQGNSCGRQIGTWSIRCA